MLRGAIRDYHYYRGSYHICHLLRDTGTSFLNLLQCLGSPRVDTTQVCSSIPYLGIVAV